MHIVVKDKFDFCHLESSEMTQRPDIARIPNDKRRYMFTLYSSSVYTIYSLNTSVDIIKDKKSSKHISIIISLIHILINYFPVHCPPKLVVLQD